VTARILDVNDVVQIGEFFESGPVVNFGGVETDLAWKIQRWARPDRRMSLDEFRRRHPTPPNTARESYVRGLLAPTADQRHRLFTQAVRLDASFAQPLFVLGREHFLKDNFREAAGWLDRVPRHNLNFIESRFLLALCRYQLSEFDAARVLFEEIAPQLPVPELWNNLGAAQARLNDPRSFESFKKALEAEPADSDYQFNVGYSLWKRGDFATAANYFRAVLDHARDDQDALQLLGRCLKKSGPRAGDWRTDGLERLKESYEEPSGR
jgi:tetratricopeptide (TPR) repeat protein